MGKEQKKVYEVLQRNDYVLKLNILAESEEDAKKKFEELTDEGQFNYDDLKIEWRDCDKPEVVEEYKEKYDAAVIEREEKEKLEQEELEKETQKEAAQDSEESVNSEVDQKETSENITE